MVDGMLRRLSELQRLPEKKPDDKYGLAPDKSYFANVVTAATRALLKARGLQIAEDLGERRLALTRLSSPNIKSNSVYPFDPDRFARLNEIIRSH
jgi:hypothetical protein